MKNTLLGFVIICVAVLLIALMGVPLWLRKIPPNRFYGFRTRRTLSDEATWYRANALLGRNLVIGAVPFLILADGIRWAIGGRAAIHASALLLAAYVLVTVWLADRESRR